MLSSLIPRRRRGNIAKPRGAIGLLPPFVNLPGRLQAVVQSRQQITHGALAHRMAPLHQFLGPSRRTFAGPAQRRPPVAARRWFDQPIQVAQQRRGSGRQLLAPATLGATAAHPSRQPLAPRCRIGGFGQYRHYARPATPANTDVISPNNDTAYSWAWLDLRREPIVLQTPELDEGRYNVFQWMDLYTSGLSLGVL